MRNSPRARLAAVLGACLISLTLVAIGATSASAENIIKNPNFSAGEAAWFSGQANGAALALDTTDGRGCLDITAAGSNPWDAILFQTGLNLTSGTTYTVSFEASADRARPMSFKTGSPAPAYDNFFYETVDLTTSTQTFSTTYVQTESSNGQLEFHLGAEGTGRVCIDNVSIDGPGVTTTTGGDGQPPEGESLRFYADRQGFSIGAAAGSTNIVANETHNRVLAREFNTVTAENAMKMGPLRPNRQTFDWGTADAIVDFARTNNMQVHGHVLVWYNQVPNWVTNGNFNRAEMIDIMYEHIDTVVGRYADDIGVWDVVNEAVNDNNRSLRPSVWLDRIGDDYIDLAFRRARQADPDAQLIYNDYNAAPKGWPKADYIYDVVKGMVERGVPIDGVGFQMHFSTSYPDPSKQAVLENMQRYADLGLDVYITEIDVRIELPADENELARQEKIYREMLEACLEMANCKRYTTWGISTKDHWVPIFFPGEGEAAMFDDNYEPRRPYYAVRDVLAANDSGPATTTTVPSTTTTAGPTTTTAGPTTTTAGPTTTAPTTSTTAEPSTTVGGPFGTSCTVDQVDTWPGGFVAYLSIDNYGPDSTNGWQATLDFTAGPISISQFWSSTITGQGGSFVAENVDYNAVIAPGGEATFGLVGSGDPAGVTCSTAGK